MNPTADDPLRRWKIHAQWRDIRSSQRSSRISARSGGRSAAAGALPTAQRAPIVPTGVGTISARRAADLPPAADLGSKSPLAGEAPRPMAELPRAPRKFRRGTRSFHADADLPRGYWCEVLAYGLGLLVYGFWSLLSGNTSSGELQHEMFPLSSKVGTRGGARERKKSLKCKSQK